MQALAVLTAGLLAPRLARAIDGNASGMTLQARTFTGNPRDVALEGDVAWIALDTGVAAYDVSDATAPIELSHVALPGEALDLAVSSGLVLLADGEAGLAIVDGRSPAAPSLLALVPGSATRAVAWSGSVGVVVESGAAPRLRTLDLTDPTEPAPLGSVALPAGALDVTIAGTTAFVGLSSGLAIVDVSAPASPTLVATLPTGLPVNGVAVSGPLAALATGVALAGSLELVDVSIPAAPVRRGRLSLPDEALGVSLASGLAHVADRTRGLLTIDVSDPSVPVIVDALVSGREAVAVSSRGDVDLVCERSSSGQAALAVVATPRAPARLAALGAAPFAEMTGIAAAPGIAWILRRDALHALDTPASGPVSLLGSWAPAGSDLSALSVSGVLGAVSQGENVHLVDLSDPTNPRELGAACVSEGAAVDPVLDGSTLYVANGRSLDVFDVTVPASPVSLATWSGIGWVSSVAVQGGLAVVAGGSRLEVLDVSLPSAPASLGSLDVADQAQAVALDRGLVVVAGLANLVEVVDVSTPSAPVLLGVVPDGPAFDVTMNGSRAYVAAGDAGAVVVDLASPRAPAVVAYYDTSSVAVAIAVDGATVHVATLDAQHWMLSCDACAAGCLARAALTASATRVCFGTPVMLDASASTVTGCAGSSAYGWLVNGMPVAGATGSAYVLPATTPPGMYDVTADVSCPTSPGCAAQASVTVTVDGDTFPTIDPASLRVHKQPVESELSWVILSGAGQTNVHRSLDPRIVTASRVGPDSLFAVAPTTSATDTDLPGTGRCFYYVVYGRASCSGGSVVP